MKDTQRIGRKYEVQKSGRMKKHYPTPEERKEALKQQREAWNEMRDLWQAATQRLESESAEVVQDAPTNEEPAFWMKVVAVALGVAVAMGVVYGIAYGLVLLASIL